MALKRAVNWAMGLAGEQLPGTLYTGSPEAYPISQSAEEKAAMLRLLTISSYLAQHEMNYAQEDVSKIMGARDVKEAVQSVADLKTRIDACLGIGKFTGSVLSDLALDERGVEQGIAFEDAKVLAELISEKDVPATWQDVALFGLQGLGRNTSSSEARDSMLASMAAFEEGIFNWLDYKEMIVSGGQG